MKPEERFSTSAPVAPVLTVSRYRAYIECRKSDLKPTGRELILPEGINIIAAWQLAFHSLREAGMKPINGGFGGLIGTGKTCWRLDRNKEVKV